MSAWWKDKLITKISTVLRKRAVITCLWRQYLPHSFRVPLSCRSNFSRWFDAVIQLPGRSTLPICVVLKVLRVYNGSSVPGPFPSATNSPHHSPLSTVSRHMYLSSEPFQPSVMRLALSTYVCKLDSTQRHLYTLDELSKSGCPWVSVCSPKQQVVLCASETEDFHHHHQHEHTVLNNKAKHHRRNRLAIYRQQFSPNQILLNTGKYFNIRCFIRVIMK